MHKSTNSAEIVLARLAEALLNDEGASVGQCVMDLHRIAADFSLIALPPTKTHEQAVVAAAVIELLAERKGDASPAWTRLSGALSQPRFLMGGYEIKYPALAKQWLREAPNALKRRNIFASAEFLEFV